MKFSNYQESCTRITKHLSTSTLSLLCRFACREICFTWAQCYWVDRKQDTASGLIVRLSTVNVSSSSDLVRAELFCKTKDSPRWLSPTSWSQSVATVKWSWVDVKFSWFEDSLPVWQLGLNSFSKLGFWAPDSASAVDFNSDAHTVWHGEFTVCHWHQEIYLLSWE